MTEETNPLGMKPETCTTCGRVANDPKSGYCSNSFHNKFWRSPEGKKILAEGINNLSLPDKEPVKDGTGSVMIDAAIADLSLRNEVAKSIPVKESEQEKPESRTFYKGHNPEDLLKQINELQKKVNILKDTLRKCHASLRTYGIHPLIDTWVNESLKSKP